MKWYSLDRLRAALRRTAPVSGAVHPSAAIQVPLGNRLRWLSRHWLRAAGWPGMLALAVLAVLPAFYLSAIRPLQAHLDEVRHSVARQLRDEAHAGKENNGGKRSTNEQLVEYYRFFPPARSAPQWMEKLVALAESRGLRLDQAEYQATPDKVGKLVRFQMTLPLKGQYPQIRRFLAALPGEIPVMALEKVQFERQNITDPEVEASLRLVLYLGRSS